MRKIPQVMAILAAGAALFWAGATKADDVSAAALDQGPYALVATFTVKPDTRDKYIQAMMANIEASRKEPGVVLYRAYQVTGDPTKFVSVEFYKDKAAFDAHLKSPHVMKVSETFKDILAKDIDVVFVSPLQ
jgi:quinol monooxygenase YgiN